MMNQLNMTFAKAGRASGIPFKVSPHVLRASAVTYLKQQGFQDASHWTFHIGNGFCL